jgi:iron complex transport system permease protein
VTAIQIHNEPTDVAPPSSRLVPLLLCVCLLCASAMSILVGRYHIGFMNMLSIIWKHFTAPSEVVGSPLHLILFNVRLPRMCAAVVIGGGLSASGACYQTLFRNPMVEPSLLGVTQGAAFGAALAILFSAGIAVIQAASFLFGLAAVLSTVALSSFVGKNGEKSLTIILCGIVTGTLFAAFLSFAKYVADPYSKLPAITYWLLGSLASVSMHDVRIAALLTLTGLVPVALLRWRINALSFGDEEAKALGVNTSAVRAAVISASTLMTATSVSISGMIGWVGLVIPHLARMMVGPSFATLLPSSALLGALFLLVVDTLARVLFPVEIPLGIVTAIVGAPFFVVLLARGKRGWL